MTAASIHPSAVIGDNVQVGDGTVVGPYCIIEDDVVIGPNNKLMAHVYVGRYTHIGEGNTIFPFTNLGMVPQDLKFKDERTTAVIGNRNVIREQSTIHRGTVGGGGETILGDDNLMMVGSHIGHDSKVGNQCILGHNSSLAGHVDVENDAVVGAYSAVHQFCRVGEHAYIGGFSVCTKDVLPYIKSVGNHAKIYGINAIGLQRKGFTEDEITGLKQAYRVLFLRKLRMVEALERLKADFANAPRVMTLVDFIESSERGVIR